MGFGSPIHWFLIATVLVLLFGNRLPSVMRSLGRVFGDNYSFP